MILRDNSKSSFTEFLTSKSIYLAELHHYLESNSNDANCAADWLDLRVLKAKFLALSLISSIHSLFSHLCTNLRAACLAVLAPLARLLCELCNTPWALLSPQLAEAFHAAVSYGNFAQEWTQKALLQQNLLRFCRELVALSYELLGPFYRAIQKEPGLHEALLKREPVAKVKKDFKDVSAGLIDRYRLLYENTTNEDIQYLDAMQ